MQFCCFIADEDDVDDGTVRALDDRGCFLIRVPASAIAMSKTEKKPVMVPLRAIPERLKGVFKPRRYRNPRSRSRSSLQHSTRAEETTQSDGVVSDVASNTGRCCGLGVVWA